jgi:predicted nucleic acid-binding protein
MSVLVDTNILLRSIEPLHSHHRLAVAAVSRLLADGTPVYFSLQNIAELWNVATRPVEKNGLGFSIPSTLAEVQKIESLLTLLPEHAGSLRRVETDRRRTRCFGGDSP